MFALRSTPLAVVLALAVPATGQQIPQEAILEALENDGRFTTFVSLIREAGLEETLAGSVHTVFAPTDAAFQALPEGTVGALRTDQEALRALVGLHVAPGSVTTTAITADPLLVTTVDGSELEVERDGESVRVRPVGTPAEEVMDDAADARRDVTVQRADWTASNGVIHVIDGVLGRTP